MYTQCTIFIIKKEITPDYPKSAAKKLIKDIKPPSNLLLLRSYVILLLWSLSVTCCYFSVYLAPAIGSPV